jgi:hypothetical protein
MATGGSDRIYRSASFLDDYVHRPQGIMDLSVYEFTMRCYRRLRNNTTSATHLFQDGHPLTSSHCLAFRRREVVPVIKGPRFTQIQDDMTDEEREHRARIALILFKPFRTPEDLLGAYTASLTPWYLAYCDWESTRSDFATTIIRYHTQYGRLQFCACS